MTVSPPYSPAFSLGEITCLAEGWSQPVTFEGDDPGSGNVVWTIDGDPASEGLSPAPLSIPPGSHTVGTVLTNAFGCVFQSSQEGAYPGLPLAAFEMAEPPCNDLNVAFTNQSSGADEFAWTFDINQDWTGLAEESQQTDPVWSYGDFGTYTAQLIVQPGAACADTLTQEVLVLPQDPLVMAFGAIEPLACSLETDVEFLFMEQEPMASNGISAGRTGQWRYHQLYFGAPGTYR